MSDLLRRVPQPVWVGGAVAVLAAGLAAKWLNASGRPQPLGLTIFLGATFVVLAGLGVVRFLRASNAPDRPPFDVFSRSWTSFFVIVGCLIGVPVIGIVTHDPKASPVAGAVMMAVGLALVAAFVRYIRKPVLDYGLTLSEFYAGDARRRRSATVEYGAAWTKPSDPAGAYAMIWLAATHEICAVRYRRLPGQLRLDPPSPLSNSLLSDPGAVEILGWADDQAALDKALAGWSAHLNDPDGMSWVRQRLKAAADATAQERASGAQT